MSRPIRTHWSPGGRCRDLFFVRFNISLYRRYYWNLWVRDLYLGGHITEGEYEDYRL